MKRLFETMRRIVFISGIWNIALGAGLLVLDGRG